MTFRRSSTPIAMFAALAVIALITYQRSPVFAQVGAAKVDEAKARGWTVVSMKDDWKRVFAFETSGGQ